MGVQVLGKRKGEMGGWKEVEGGGERTRTKTVARSIPRRRRVRTHGMEGSPNGPFTVCVCFLYIAWLQ